MSKTPSIKALLDVYAPSNAAEPPMFYLIELTECELERLETLSALCEQHGVAVCADSGWTGVWECPVTEAQWKLDTDTAETHLRVDCGSIRIVAARPAYSLYLESGGISIKTLRDAFNAGESMIHACEQSVVDYYNECVSD